MMDYRGYLNRINEVQNEMKRSKQLWDKGLVVWMYKRANNDYYDLCDLIIKDGKLDERSREKLLEFLREK